jgi:hypothetical protein
MSRKIYLSPEGDVGPAPNRFAFVFQDPNRFAAPPTGDGGSSSEYPRPIDTVLRDRNGIRWEPLGILPAEVTGWSGGAQRPTPPSPGFLIGSDPAP